MIPGKIHVNASVGMNKMTWINTDIERSEGREM